MTIEDLNKDTKLLLENLRSRVCWAEGEWGGVYIDGALEDLNWSKAEISGHLSVLKKAGLYDRIDGFFGKVKLND